MVLRKPGIDSVQARLAADLDGLASGVKCICEQPAVVLRINLKPAVPQSRRGPNR
jgi:hypothetical protein